ncbi:alcohol acetyltransferase [Mycena epipterygia]|nr:alcohol acetyltransferase [Mycena epipterygia]
MPTKSHLRPIGLLERLHATQHFLGLESCVATSAKYITEDGAKLTPDILFAALREVIKSHPALSVKLQNESTSNAVFVRLETIDLSQVVEFSTTDNLQTSLESQLARGFDTDADLPIWRIQVLTDNTVILAIYHVIGDGLSGPAFHASLLKALQNVTVRDSSSLVQISDTIVLSPPVEACTRLRPSLSMVLVTIYELFAPTSWTRACTAWSGKPVPSTTNLKTNVRIMTIPPPNVATFSAECRTHRATVTSALYVLTVAIVSRMIARDPANYKTISSVVAISLREVSGMTKEAICDFTSAQYAYPPMNPNFTWAAAAHHAVELQKQKRDARGTLGLLRLLFGNYVPYLKDKLGKKRESGFVISNLGRFDAPAVEGTWNIVSTVFAQCDVVAGSAFKLNVICDPSGAVNIAFTWGDDSIDNGFVESFIFQFQDAFNDLIV